MKHPFGGVFCFQNNKIKRPERTKCTRVREFQELDREPNVPVTDTSLPDEDVTKVGPLLAPPRALKELA